MTNNDILRRLRYALDISNSTMVEIFKQADHGIEQPDMIALLKKEDEEGYVACSDEVMGYFLDGLINHKRGRQELAPGKAWKLLDPSLTNNTILKKLRIALELKEDDMLGILKLADVAVSKAELSAFFRKEGQKNYKECGDQFLRNFLKGLTLHYRK
jgi:uncharacterized protein YehS (DUF1456 family)